METNAPLDSERGQTRYLIGNRAAEMARRNDEQGTDDPDDRPARGGSDGGLGDLFSRVSRLESDLEAIRLDWLDTLGKLTKIGNKMAAQNRRDIAAAADDQVQLALQAGPPTAPLDRAGRKAALRRLAASHGGNGRAG